MAETSLPTNEQVDLISPEAIFSDEEERSGSSQLQSSRPRFGIKVGAVAFLVAALTSILATTSLLIRPFDEKNVRIAFLGNSMFYFNDFPRFLEALSDTRVTQNSCLHGGASISTLLTKGNGMYPQFMTDKALLDVFDNHSIYDYGACTAHQLLFGKDANLTQQFQEKGKNLNPCHEDVIYRQYTEWYFENNKPQWDTVLINDNTRNPARNHTRQKGLQVLEATYVPWLLETGATPVFLLTHAYSVNSTEKRNMTGLENIPNFTSLTSMGYRQYADLLEQHLPALQKPRIAPSGIAFLTVWEEDRDMWHRLFHSDHIHASPHGSFLQGCVVHYTLFGRMPRLQQAIRKDMSTLWSRARMMQHAWEPPNPMLTEQDAQYLYKIAERVAKEGYRPKSFIEYENGEALV